MQLFDKVSERHPRSWDDREEDGFTIFAIISYETQACDEKCKIWFGFIAI